MLSEIESAVLERLQAKLQEPSRASAIGNSAKPGHTIKVEEILVGIESGNAKRITQDFLEIAVNLYVTLTFKNLRSEEARRKGIYPLVLATIGYLHENCLGLSINPLNFKNFQNTTTEEQVGNGMVHMTMLFTSSFQIRKIDDAESDELVMLGLSYHLQPDNGEADLEGQINF